ncbi:MAG: MBL fold metallo-hydrolase, partial [Gammaproteobacteria bacterium]|nr:MBL fold metallo-hydrolase [Gammaproteobacteria bacterium]
MPELSYPFPSHPEEKTLIEVCPGVYWLTMPMGGGSLNHINLYLLEDDTGWWVVDTGLAIPEVTELWQQIFSTELKGKPVKAVICTHMH